MSLRRYAAIAVTTLVAALLSPVLVAAPAQAAQVTGVMDKSYTNYWGASWVDATISDDFTVGAYYEETLVLPATRPWTFYDENDARSAIPAGMTVVFPGGGDYNGTGEVVLKGTPTAKSASTSIVLAFNGYSGDEMWLTFDNIVIKAAPTTTTVDDPGYWDYTGVNLTATVSPSAASGTVEFFLGATSIGSRVVSGGSASFSGAVPASFVGTSPVVTAVYSGDATYASSTSTSDPSLYVHGDRIIYGTVMKNGVPQPGIAVRLLTSTYAVAGPTDTTDVDGEFQLDVGDPASFVEAQLGYAIEAPGLGIYYSTSPGPGGSNVSFIGDATVIYEADWSSDHVIYENVPPTWTDDTLAQPRLGTAYSDSVAATTYGTPSTITYTVTGDVPSWLSFSAGTFTATNPTDQDPHTFTVKAESAYRYTTKSFTLTAGDAVIAPTFTDESVATAQAGVLLDDRVLATGTGPITYSVTAGTLPSWLTLGSTTGLIGGTPPLSAAGESYSFTVTATGYGTDATTISSVVSAAPSGALTLHFAEGDTAAGAAFDYEIAGAGDTVPFSVTVNSVPFVAASGSTSALGAAAGSASIQSDIAPGSHSIVLLTTASDGTPRTTTVWFSVLGDGTIGEISLTGPVIVGAGLASTGSDPAGALGAAFLLLLGGYLALRRRAAVRAVRVP